MTDRIHAEGCPRRDWGSKALCDCGGVRLPSERTILWSGTAELLWDSDTLRNLVTGGYLEPMGWGRGMAGMVGYSAFLVMHEWVS